MKLRTDCNFDDPDAAYSLIVAAHRGISPASHATFDAALVLLLSNHIGDLDVLGEALKAAQAACQADQK
jgi:hypothetical protein